MSSRRRPAKKAARKAASPAAPKGDRALVGRIERLEAILEGLRPYLQRRYGETYAAVDAMGPGPAGTPAAPPAPQ